MKQLALVLIIVQFVSPLAAGQAMQMTLLGCAAGGEPQAANATPSPEDLQQGRFFRVTNQRTGAEALLVWMGDCIYLISRLSTTQALSWLPGAAVSQSIFDNSDRLAAGERVMLGSGEGIPEEKCRGGFNRVWPLEHARMGSNYGPRWSRRFQKTKMHHGIDMCIDTGAPIRAVGPGRVVHAGEKGAYGLLVRIEHDDGTITSYGHCSAIHVAAGQRVQPGMQIADVGDTGRSDCPHLHFEVKRNGSTEDPRRWFSFPPKGSRF